MPNLRNLILPSYMVKDSNHAEILLNEVIHPDDYAAQRGLSDATYTNWQSGNIINFAPSSTFSVPLNFLKSYPIVIAKPCTLDKWRIFISTPGVAGSVFRVGLYSTKTGVTSPLPGNLIAGTDTEFDTTQVSAYYQSAALNVALAPGLYWVAWNAGTAAFSTFLFDNNYFFALLSQGTNPVWGIGTATAYAALNAVFPGSPPGQLDRASHNVPAIWMRFTP